MKNKKILLIVVLSINNICLYAQKYTECWAEEYYGIDSNNKKSYIHKKFNDLGELIFEHSIKSVGDSYCDTAMRYATDIYYTYKDSLQEESNEIMSLENIKTKYFYNATKQLIKKELYFFDKQFDTNKWEDNTEEYIYKYSGNKLIQEDRFNYFSPKNDQHDYKIAIKYDKQGRKSQENRINYHNSKGFDFKSDTFITTYNYFKGGYCKKKRSKDDTHTDTFLTDERNNVIFHKKTDSENINEYQTHYYYDLNGLLIKSVVECIPEGDKPRITTIYKYK